MARRRLNPLGWSRGLSGLVAGVVAVVVTLAVQVPRVIDCAEAYAADRRFDAVPVPRVRSAPLCAD